MPSNKELKERLKQLEEQNAAWEKKEAEWAAEKKEYKDAIKTLKSSGKNSNVVKFSNKAGQTAASATSKRTLFVPPIFMNGGSRELHLLMKEHPKMEKEAFCMTLLGDGKVSVMAKDKQFKEVLLDVMREHKIEHYTFPRKAEMPAKLVLTISGFVTDYTDEQVLNELKAREELAVKPLEVKRMSRYNEETRTKEPLMNYLVSFPPGTKVKDVEALFFLFSKRVYFRKFKKVKDHAVQCYRCQTFGHVQANCNMKRRCAQCTFDHGGKECHLGANMPTAILKCCLCDEYGHPASSKACPKRAEYLKNQKLALANKKFREMLVKGPDDDDSSEEEED